MTDDGRTRRKPPEPVSSEILDRQPPFDLSAEMAVIGSMIKGTDFGELILGDIKGEDFHDNANRLIFEAIVSLLEQSRPIDAGILVDRLKARGSFERCGGMAYLAKCITSVGPGYNIVHYARIVSKHALRRRSIDAAMNVLRYCYDDQSSGEPEEREIASKVDELFSEAIQLRSIEVHEAAQLFPRVGENIQSRMSGKQVSSGIKTGHRAIDEMTGGLFPNEIIVVAARTSMGKTSLTTQWAVNISFAGTHVLYVSLETSADSLAMSKICSWSGVSVHKVKTNKASVADAWVVESVTSDLATCKLSVLDRPNVTAREIISVAKHIKRKATGPIVVMVDYLQLVEFDGSGTRNDQIGKFMRQMRRLASEIESPVVLLAQLNRSADGEKDKRPRMSQLRESGNIEQDADVIMLLHRQEYYEPKNPEVRGLADVIIAKNKTSPTGTAELLWDGRTLSFKDKGSEEIDDSGSQSEWDKEQTELPF